MEQGFKKNQGQRRNPIELSIDKRIGGSRFQIEKKIRGIAMQMTNQELNRRIETNHMGAIAESETISSIMKSTP